MGMVILRSYIIADLKIHSFIASPETLHNECVATPNILWRLSKVQALARIETFFRLRVTYYGDLPQMCALRL
jgi:hypothetical protein